MNFDMTKPISNLPAVIFQFGLSAYDDWQRLAAVLKKAGNADPAKLADRLSHLTVKQLGELKSHLGIKASGVKAELARKIAERALAGGPAPKAEPGFRMRAC